MPGTVTAESLRLLLKNAVDYAGLFPPAGLGMRDAVRNYATYRAGEHAWLLGRFVVPATRLDEFGAAMDELGPENSAERWRLSALLGADAAADVEQVTRFNATQTIAVIDTCEVRSESTAGLEATARRVPSGIRAFFEVPLHAVDDLAAAAAGAGVGIKARTGGVTADAFPTADDVVKFIRAALNHAVPFKLTAGLHHPIRGDYRLTYEPGAACGAMFGFLGVFVAAALLAADGSDADAVTVLEDRDAGAFQFEGDRIRWHGKSIDVEAVARVRRKLAGFGSCSFVEPVDELTALGLLA